MEDYIENILSGNAILFTGAGFSYGAINALNKPVFLGNTLTQYLAKNLKDYSPNTYDRYPLDMIARQYIEERGAANLVKCLKHAFQIKNICDYHKELAQLPWKRVYTTNYDNLFEVACDQTGGHVRSVTSYNDVSKTEKDNVVIHLNGYIDRMDESTLKKEVKLLGKSYSQRDDSLNDWLAFMESDFMIAQSIIIIGFSMVYDLDIRRKLFSPALKHKIIFITKENIPNIEKNELKQYGRVLDIGVENFANKIKSIKEDYNKSTLKIQYSQFKQIKPESIPIEGASYKDYSNFYYQGILSPRLFKKNALGEYISLVRRIKLNKVIEHLQDRTSEGKIFVIHSYLGNGKTVFLHLLTNELAQKNVAVFILNKRYDPIEVCKEFETISKIKRNVLIIIDDSFDKLEVLQNFKAFQRININYLLAVRTSLLDRTCQEIELQELGKELKVIDLNILSGSECLDFAQIIVKEHLLSRDLLGNDIEDIKKRIQDQDQAKIANIVLDLYDSSDIKKRFDMLVSNAIKEDKTLKHFLVLLLCDSVYGLGLKNELPMVMDYDFSEMSQQYREIFGEIFYLEKQEVMSPVMAKAMLRDIISPDAICESMELLVKTLCNNKYYREAYENIIKAAISHTNFSTLLQRNDGQRAVQKFYDSLRNLPFLHNNPFFWEEFAISYLDCEEFELAHQCIDKAYGFGKLIPGFEPFQIATVEADYILRKTESSILNLSTDGIAENIVQVIEMLLRYYNNPKNNKTYVFSVARRIVKIYKTIQKRLNQKEASKIWRNVQKLKIKLDEYLKKNRYKKSLFDFQNELEKLIYNAKRIV